MGRPPLTLMLPACLDALDVAEDCLRRVGSDWRRTPLSIRIVTMIAANAVLPVLMQAGRR
jgi:hypothetical protein